MAASLPVAAQQALAALSCAQTLQAVGVIEKDVNGDLVTWNFPSLDKAAEIVIKSRSGLQDKDLTTLSSDALQTPYRFSRYKNSWQYMYVVYNVEGEIESKEAAASANADNADNAAANSNVNKTKVRQVCVFIQSSAYNPEKYETLLKNYFIPLYFLSSPIPSPIPILNAWLQLFTSGRLELTKVIDQFTASNPNATIQPDRKKALTSTKAFVDSEFDNRRALIAPVKRLLELFGAEAVHIWTAVLLKKRIFVYSPKLSELLSVVRAIPLIGAWHRQNLDLLRPFCRATESELADLSSNGIYIAGFTDSNVLLSHKHMWDLSIDLSTKALNVHDNARNDFTLSSGHRKTIIPLFAHILANNETEQNSLKLIAQETKNFIENIVQLKEGSQALNENGLNEENIRAQQPKIQNELLSFILNVARAEGMIKK